MATKREHEYGDEAPASKKAKEEEERSGDEIMSDDDDETMSDRDSESEEEEEEDLATKFDIFLNMRDSFWRNPDDDIVREFQIFLEMEDGGDSDRANKICSESDACKVFSEEELNKFSDLYWSKMWHIRVNPPGPALTDYQRLAIFPYKNRTHRFRSFIGYYFTYEFDRAYPIFTDELSQNTKWGTTAANARPIAEQLWKKHMPDTDFHLGLLYDSVKTAICDNNAIQSSIELSSLFFNLYKREVEVKDYAQALKEIIEEKGLGSYPFSKAFIEEEGLKKHEGLLWKKYCFVKSFSNIENGETLEDNRVKDGIDNFFKLHLQGLCGYEYTKYVERKISIAKGLGILPKEVGR